MELGITGAIVVTEGGLAVAEIRAHETARDLRQTATNDVCKKCGKVGHWHESVVATRRQKSRFMWLRMRSPPYSSRSATTSSSRHTREKPAAKESSTTAHAVTTTASSPPRDHAAKKKTRLRSCK